MRYQRALLAIAVVAVFLAVPLISAEAEATGKTSWNEGEAAAYYKVSGINDKAELDKLCDISAIQKYIIGQDLAYNVSDLTVKSVSGISMESGMLMKVKGDSYTKEIFFTIAGTVEYTAKTATNPFLLKMYLDKGELYDKINATISLFDIGKPVTIKCTFEYKKCTIESGKCSEAMDYYPYNEYKLDIPTFSSASTVDVTVNGTSFKYDVKFAEEAASTRKCTYDPAISKDKDAPETCRDNISTTVYNCGTTITGTVDGKTYQQYNDKEDVERTLKSKDGNHINADTDGVYGIAADVSFMNITNGFTSSSDAKTYITGTLGGQTLDTYSAVAEKAKSYERPQNCDNGDNTMIIIIGVVIAVIVIAAILFFVFKKKSA